MPTKEWISTTEQHKPSHGLREELKAVRSNWAVKLGIWVITKTPVTTGTVILLWIIYSFTGGGEAAEGLIQEWGLAPSKPHTYLTHAFLHFNLWHILTNTTGFWIFGAIMERSLGGAKLAVFTLLTAAAAAVMTVMAVPEYWDTNSSPAGFSAVTNAVFVIGAYIGSRQIAVGLGKAVAARVGLIRTRTSRWPWQTVCSAIGVACAGAAVAWVMHDEWGSSDAAPRVAHMFGTLAGALVIAMVVKSNKRDVSDHPLRGRPPASHYSTHQSDAAMPDEYPEPDQPG